MYHQATFDEPIVIDIKGRRTLRGFIYGVFSVVTIIYLIKNNLTPLEAGITVTASILVSSFLTFYVTSRYGVTKTDIAVIMSTTVKT